MSLSFHRIARAPGERFDCDQLEGVCEGCELPHSHCACDPERTSCETCEGALTFTGWCFACDDFTPLTETIVTVDRDGRAWMGEVA